MTTDCITTNQKIIESLNDSEFVHDFIPEETLEIASELDNSINDLITCDGLVMSEENVSLYEELDGF